MTIPLHATGCPFKAVVLNLLLDRKPMSTTPRVMELRETNTCVLSKRMVLDSLLIAKMFATLELPE